MPAILIRFLVLLLTGIICLCGCRDSSRPQGDTSPSKIPVEISPAPRKFNFKPKVLERPAELASVLLDFPHFRDVAQELGVIHTYDNGASPKALMVESTGGGCGWIDYDRDGRLDLYLTQGGRPDASSEADRPADAFFRQTSAGQFIPLGVASGIDERRYSQGVTMGDFDNDGFDDLFVANVGESRFFQNQGDGTFIEVTSSLAGLRHVWSSTPAWGDIDKDGDLDLYICNYAIYDPYHPIPCLDKTGVPSICHPRNAEPEPDQFFLNLGDGQFREASQAMGLFGPGNRALGVVIADLNGDSWPDIYVANDTTANFYFVNKNGQSFRDAATLLGGGYCATGEAQASMGVAFGDYDHNGYPDLCLSHFTGEHNTLYQNMGPKGLQDVSAITGLRELSLPKLGFGIVMSDFNQDGHCDLFVANGHIDPRYADGEGYEMTAQIHSFDGSRWQDGSSAAGDYFHRKLVGRGAASADYDRDGDLDLVVVHHNKPVSLLQNDSVVGQHLSVRLLGRTSNRNGFGTLVQIDYDGHSMKLELAGGTSFSASHEKVVQFGFGNWSGPGLLKVSWPSGIMDTISLDQCHQDLTILEGVGPITLAGEASSQTVTKQ